MLVRSIAAFRVVRRVMALASTARQLEQPAMSANARSNLGMYFTIYDKHQALFSSEGLFTFQPQTLSQNDRDVVDIVRQWLDGNIQAQQLSLKQVTILLNITSMLFTKKSKHPQLQDTLAKFQAAVEQYLIDSHITVDNIRKLFELLNFLVLRRKDQSISVVKAKINRLIAQNQNIDMKIVEQILQFFMPLGMDGLNANKMFLNTPLKEILDLQIHVEYLPRDLFKGNVAMLCDHIDDVLEKSRSQQVGISRMSNIFKLLSHFPSCREVTNTTINIVMHLMWLGEKAKQVLKCDRQTINFMLELLSSQQCSLIVLYLLKSKQKDIIRMFNVKKYFPYSQQPLLNQTIIRILIYKHEGLADKGQTETVINEFGKHFADISAFLTLYKAIRNIQLPKLLQNLNEIYHKEFKAFPNPFQNADSFTTHQKAYFMEYLFRVYSYKDKQIFIKKYEEQLTNKFVYKVVALHLQQKQAFFVPDKYYNFLLICGFKEAITNKSRKMLQLGLNFLIKYRKPGIQRSENQYTELKIWILINKYIDSIDKIIELSLENSLFTLLRSYIDIEYKNYKHDYHYKHLICKLLNVLPKIEPYQEIFHIIVNEALQCNLITDRYVLIIKSVTINDQQLSKEKMLKLACIKGEDIHLDKIEEDVIQPLLVNSRYQFIINQNIKRILEILQKAKTQTLFNCLAAYNLPKSQQNHKILKLLLDLVAKRITDKNTHQIDSLGIFKQCLKLNNFNVIEYNVLWQHFVKSLFFKLYRLTFESHIKHMEYLNTQPVEKINTQLTNKFLLFTHKLTKESPLIYKATYVQLSYQLVLANFNHSDKAIERIKKILRIIQPKFIRLEGIALMLLLEDKFSPLEVKSVVGNFERYYEAAKKNWTKRCQFIYDMHYNYLCKKYPQMMSNLKLSQNECQPYIFTNKHPQIYHRLINDICAQLKCKSTAVRAYGGNSIMQIKDTLLVFISPLKNGCTKEHILISKMLKLLEGKQCEVVIVHFYEPQTYEKDMLKRIFKKSSLLNNRQFQHLAGIVEKRAKGVAEFDLKDEPQEETPAEEKGEDEQIKDIAVEQEEPSEDDELTDQS